MGKKTKTTQTRTYDHKRVPDTPDIQNYRNSAKNIDYSTPVYGTYGRAENAVNDQLYSDDLPEEAVNRMKLGKLFNLNMQKGAALSNAKGQEHNARLGHQGNIARLTAPQLIQTGGTNVRNDGFNFNSLLGLPFQAARAF